jgi:tRNA(fMet)-specific endonuclease VapC
MYVLDTDHISLAFHDDPNVCSRIAAVPPSEIVVSIISVEELLTGWYSRARKARDAAKLLQAYEGLFRTVVRLQTLTIVPFVPDAVYRYLDLRRQYRRHGKSDLAIAAIALECGATVVTANTADFEQIEGLRIEDWSQPHS